MTACPVKLRPAAGLGRRIFWSTAQMDTVAFAPSVAFAPFTMTRCLSKGCQTTQPGKSAWRNRSPTQVCSAATVPLCATLPGQGVRHAIRACKGKPPATVHMHTSHENYRFIGRFRATQRAIVEMASIAP